MDLTDPHGRAKVRRLYKQRVAQFPLDPLADRIGMALPIRAHDEFPGNNGKARIAKQALHYILIHAGGGGKHPSADVGNIPQF